MKTHVGIFTSQADAAVAYRDLRSLNLRGEDLIVLTPEASLEQLEGIPVEEGEQPGMGKAIGGVNGGAVGLAAGAAVAVCSCLALVQLSPLDWEPVRLELAARWPGRRAVERSKRCSRAAYPRMKSFSMRMRSGRAAR